MKYSNYSCVKCNSVQQGELYSEKLFYSGEEGDVNRCLELIRNGADVNWRAGNDLVSNFIFTLLNISASLSLESLIITFNKRQNYKVTLIYKFYFLFFFCTITFKSLHVPVKKSSFYVENWLLSWSAFKFSWLQSIVLLYTHVSYE